MKKGFVFLIIGILLFTVTLISHTSSLHNIDLSWNAKHIDKLTDSNGIIEQDLLSIYQRSYLTLWAMPFLYLFSNILIFLGMYELI